MPWTCLKCGSATYRRDRLCGQRRPGYRGRNNKKLPKYRLRAKTALPATGRSCTYGPRSSRAAAAQSPVLQEWQACLEQDFSADAHDMQLTLSARHSVYAHAHSIIEASWQELQGLPPPNAINILGLLTLCTSLSTRVTDPDALCPLWAKQRRLQIRQVTKAQCWWINVMGRLTSMSFIDV